MEQLLKVFISYSGNQSKFVASQLRTLLKRTCAAADPWTSSDDLRLGGPWHYELMKELQCSHFGIICLDRSNLQSPWLHFEAGAIAKTLELSSVFPYLYRVEPKDLSGPLANFQGVSADRQGTLALVSALNKILQNKGMPFQTDSDLSALFDAFWPQFEASLNQAPVVPISAGTERSDSEVIGELLANSRMHSRLLASVLRATPLYYPPIHSASLPEVSPNQDMARLRFEQLRREAMNLRETGHYAEALAVFGQALALQPEDLETQIDHAVTRTYIDEGAHYAEPIQTLLDIVAEHGAPRAGDTTSTSIVAKAFYNLACIKEIARNDHQAQFSTLEILSDLEEAFKRYPLYVNTASADQDLMALRSEEGFRTLIERFRRALR